MREIVMIQVGQCGNQIGWRFWEACRAEHSAFDDAMSTFFAERRDGTVRARAVLLDMEEGVLSQVRRSPIHGLFDESQMLADVSGCGNNWARGFCQSGPRFAEPILECIRRQVEACESPQACLFLHSLGGGTGSGVGSYVLQQVEDAFPELSRFVNAVFPSEDDDVVTSPYNSVLALRQLAEHADCVLPVENDALTEIVRRGTPRLPSTASSAAAGSAATAGRAAAATGPERVRSSRGTAFDSMNDIAARMLTNLTAGMRFAGPLNVDLNEITTNLVPFPGLHFVMPAMSPLAVPPPHPRSSSFSAAASASASASASSVMLPEPRSIDAMFTEALHPSSQLLHGAVSTHTFLACALLCRGDVLVSDVQRNIERMRPTMRLAWFNTDGFKVGLCAVPPRGVRRSVISVSNNCCIADTFERLRGSFVKLYTVRAHTHHYTELLGEEHGGMLDEAAEAITRLASEYTRLDGSDVPPADWASGGDEAVMRAIGLA